MTAATQFAHPEAFCLMQYECKDCGSVEIIWNSRDGVTPFVIGCARTGCDGEATHVRWGDDQRAQDYLPPLGSRIFVDLTEDRAKRAAAWNAQRFWDTYPPPREQFETVDDLAAMLAREYTADIASGTPDLIVVSG